MHVQVMDFLPTLGTGVNDHTKTTFRIRLAALFQRQSR